MYRTFLFPDLAFSAPEKGVRGSLWEKWNCSCKSLIKVSRLTCADYQKSDPFIFNLIFTSNHFCSAAIHIANMILIRRNFSSSNFPPSKLHVVHRASNFKQVLFNDIESKTKNEHHEGQEEEVLVLLDALAPMNEICCVANCSKTLMAKVKKLSYWEDSLHHMSPKCGCSEDWSGVREGQLDRGVSHQVRQTVSRDSHKGTLISHGTPLERWNIREANHWFAFMSPSVSYSGYTTCIRELVSHFTKDLLGSSGSSLWVTSSKAAARALGHWACTWSSFPMHAWSTGDYRRSSR